MCVFPAGGNMERKWKKPWDAPITQEQEVHLTGNLVTDRWR